MTTRLLVDDLAQHIRKADSGNKLTPQQLGYEIAFYLGTLPRHLRRDSADIIAFTKRTNPDKAMGAGQLAELIVAEFDLDKER